MLRLLFSRRLLAWALLATLGAASSLYSAPDPGPPLGAPASVSLLTLNGVLGAICLLLGRYALQLLPVNYAGMALLLFGVACMVAEAFLPSFGVLGIGGVAAFGIGAVILIDTEVPGFGIPLPIELLQGLGEPKRCPDRRLLMGSSGRQGA